MPRRYFSEVPQHELPSAMHLLVIMGLMWGAVLCVMLLHPSGH